MKKIVCLIMMVLVFSGVGYCQKKVKKQAILTTGDVYWNYKILRVISERGNSIEDVNTKLFKEANKMRADGVVEIQYFKDGDWLFGVGTAVRKKKK